MNKEYLVIANWKLNMDVNNTNWWVDKFEEHFEESDAYKVAIAPSFTEIPILLNAIGEADLEEDVEVYAQDISQFEKGKYTGEVSGFQLIEHGVMGVIIGHSERRKFLGETNKVINQKIIMATEYDLKPVVCVSNFEQVEAISSILTDSIRHRIVIAYEPLEAIGSGHPDSPEHVDHVLTHMKKILGDSVPTIYGGSIDADNISDYLDSDLISGFLVGTASIKPQDFLDILDRIHEG